MDSGPVETVYPSDTPTDNAQIVSKLHPVPHELTTTSCSRSIAIAGWTVTSTKLPICSSSDCDKLAADLKIPVPEMTFGNNSVAIHGPNGWECEFNSQRALDAVDKTGSHGIKVSYSEQWNRTRLAHIMFNLGSFIGRKIVKISRGYSSPTTGHIPRLTEEPLMKLYSVQDEFY